LALALDESKETDNVFEINGLTYLVDKSLEEQAKEIKVDRMSAWAAEPHAAALVVVNLIQSEKAEVCRKGRFFGFLFDPCFQPARPL
jgi:hypothetical protein